GPARRGGGNGRPVRPARRGPAGRPGAGPAGGAGAGPRLRPQPGYPAPPDPLGGARRPMSTGQVIACDVGGTGIKAGLVDAAGRVSHAVTVPTPVVSGDGDATATAVLDRVAALAADLSLAARAQPVALGVVVPGLVDAAAGMARYSENLGWRDVPFAARLAR